MECGATSRRCTNCCPRPSAPEKMVLRAGKLDALKLMRSTQLPERILALQRLVFEDPTLERLPVPGKLREAIAEIEDGLADLVAQRGPSRTRSSRKVSLKMAERHQEYLAELKLEALREDGGPETPATQRKLEELVELDAAKAGRLGLTAAASRVARRGRRTALGDRLAAGKDLLAVSAARAFCTGRRASARRRLRGWRWKKRSGVGTRRSQPMLRSSRRAARRCAGIRAKRRIRCSAACTIRSIREAVASSPRAAFPSRSLDS